MDSSRSAEDMSSLPLPIEQLQLRAIEQRRQLHDRAEELKVKISETREKLDVRRQARQNFWGAAGVAAAAGLLFGYAATGAFVRR